MKRLFSLILLLAIAHLSFGCLPTVTIAASPNDTVCSGTSVTYAATMVDGGTSTTYQWYVNGSTVAATGSTMTYAPADVDSIRCVVTTSGGVCSTSVTVSSNSIFMVVHPLPAVGTITGPSSVCVGASVPLAATVPGGTWSSSNASVATINTSSGESQSLAVGSALISYTIGPDINGCSARTTFTLNVITSSFSLTGTAANLSCYNDSSGSVTLVLDPAATRYSYIWSHGASLATATGLSTGTYSVLVTDTVTRCKRSASFTVEQPDSLHAVITKESRVCYVGGFLEAEITGGTSPYHYTWKGQLDTLNGKRVTPGWGGTFTLVVTDTNGCTLTRLEDYVNIPCNNVIVSQGFSPNGDGINDKWFVFGLTEYPKSTVQVFDRWGDMVFEKTNYQSDWDGLSTGGAHLPDGTYYYLVKLNEPSKTGGDNVFKGAVLIRR